MPRFRVIEELLDTRDRFILRYQNLLLAGLGVSVASAVDDGPLEVAST